MNDAETGEIAGVSIGADEEAMGHSDEHTASESSRLIENAKRQVVVWRKRRRATIITSAALIPLSFYGAIMLDSLKSSPLPIMILFIGFFCGLLGLLSGVLMRPLRNNPLHHLWASEDTSVAGAIVEATQMMLPEVTPRAIAALVRLLPRLKAEDGHHLTAYQRTCLRRLLEAKRRESQFVARQTPPGVNVRLWDAVFFDMFGNLRPFLDRQERLSVAILEGLSQIGTEDDVRIVRRLAAGRGIARGSALIRQAAEKCLPLLEARVAASRSTDHLLRASGAPSSGEDVLLRAAAGGADVSGEQLLRPGMTGEESQNDGER